MKDNSRTVLFGLITNIFLAAIKLVAGLIGNSYALVADAIESLVDVLGSLVVFSGIQLSRRDADSDFPYGFGKAEALAAFVVGGIVILTSIGIAIEAVAEIRTPHHAPAPFTLLVLVLVIFCKEILRFFSHRAAVAEGSIALSADAFHHRSDSITSFAAGIGISIALWGGSEWASADDWAALVGSFVIFINGVLIVKHASIHLLDGAAPPKITKRIRITASSVDGVVEIEKLNVRSSGAQLYVDIHVHACSTISLFEAHNIGGNVKATLIREFPNISGVLVHMEPDINDPPAEPMAEL